MRRDTGHPPPVIDKLLAATALNHDLYLATRNVRDGRHSAAAGFNPWEDDPNAFPVILQTASAPPAARQPRPACSQTTMGIAPLKSRDPHRPDPP